MSISRGTLFGKLGITLYRSIESATTLCKIRQNRFVELVHWIHQLLQLPDSDLHRILQHARIDRDAVERDVAHALNALPAGASSLSDFSHHIDHAIERAWILASLQFGEPRIRGAWLIAALLSTPDLRRVLLSISPAFGRIPSDDLPDALTPWIEGSPERADAPYDNSDFLPVQPGEASQSLPRPAGATSFEQYCQDLTARAKAGEIDAVVGRELEIKTMIDVLLRRRQNNPLLTGEAGVGKTAVVEGLALAISNSDVPPQLASVRLMSLDVAALLAGASMKGEFEARLKGVLESAAKSPVPVVLFVDEIHTLVGAGGQAGTGDAANLLKPALARGTIRTIGATTWSEYKRHIEKDPALTRRFQVLQVPEPEERKAIEMVRGLARTFADHHRVIVRDEAIRAAVTLSHRYIPSRQLPDKAISLLDTACARVSLSQHTAPRELQDVRQALCAARVELEVLERESQIGLDVKTRIDATRARIDELATREHALEARWQAQASAAQALTAARDKAIARKRESTRENGSDHERLRSLERALWSLQSDGALVYPEVDEAVIAEVVSDWTGIPAGRMVKDEIAAVRSLPDTLATRVIGQTGALLQICERVQTARAGLSDPGKPLGVFLLAGPSGVGKTETALALAEALYGGEQNLITINMSEYQEAHTVSGLKGAPPGYVGYGEGGVLTEAVRRRPYCVVLLDEIEKAHRDVHEMFFQVFDKGYMEDGDGRFIDFRNTTILLTSNAGAGLIASLCADASLSPDQDGLRAALAPELLKTFPAAFLGRVTVAPYRPLASHALSGIVRLHLDRLVRRMVANQALALTYSDGVVDHIVSRCLVEETGARVLIGFIEQHILPRLSGLWLDALAEKRPLTSIAVDVANDPVKPARAFVFTTQPAVVSYAVDPAC